MLARRSFLQMSAAAGVAGAGGLLLPREAKAQAGPVPDPNLISAAVNIQAMHAANTYAGVSSSADFRNVASVHDSLAVDYTAKNLDAQFLPVIRNVSTNQIDFTRLDLTATLAHIQIYQPGYSMAFLQQTIAALPSDPGSISAALSNLQQGGLVSLYTVVRNHCNLIASRIDGSPTAARTARPSGANDGLGFVTQVRPPLAPPSDDGGGGASGYSCTTDDYAMMGVGVALGVIAVMALPEFGVLMLTAPFWGPLVSYGGAGLALWSVIHVKKCG